MAKPDASKEKMRKVASLARLNLSEKELDKFAGELEKILEAFRELEKIETADIKPSFQPLDISNVLRDDTAKPSLPQPDALKNARDKEGGFVKGPRVI